MEDDILRAHQSNEEYHPDPVAYLDRAYEQTLEATSAPNDCQGTTTACGAQLYYKKSEETGENVPTLFITNLGDSQVLVMRPGEKEILYKTTEQWHWFDCPFQLGTNSLDTPRKNAALTMMEIEVGDIVLAMSDGVIDNLWEHEIVRIVTESLEKWETSDDPRTKAMGRIQFAASELMTAAKTIAEDPFAESPYMEHAIEEGLASSGGEFPTPDLPVPRGEHSSLFRVICLTRGQESWMISVLWLLSVFQTSQTRSATRDIRFYAHLYIYFFFFFFSTRFPLFSFSLSNLMHGVGEELYTYGGFIPTASFSGRFKSGRVQCWEYPYNL